MNEIQHRPVASNNCIIAAVIVIALHYLISSVFSHFHVGYNYKLASFFITPLDSRANRENILVRCRARCAPRRVPTIPDVCPWVIRILHWPPGRSLRHLWWWWCRCLSRCLWRSRCHDRWLSRGWSIRRRTWPWPDAAWVPVDGDRARFALAVLRRATMVVTMFFSSFFMFGRTFAADYSHCTATDFF